MATPLEDITSFLKKNQFNAECPNCGGQFPFTKVVFFDADNFPPEAKELLQELRESQKERSSELRNRISNKTQKVETTTQSVNIGFILERLAPSLKGFRFDKNDCRSLFDPIDYVIFEGLNKTGKVQKVIFTDIKTGEARLKKNQREIKKRIAEKSVSFKTYKP